MKTFKPLILTFPAAFLAAKARNMKLEHMESTIALRLQVAFGKERVGARQDQYMDARVLLKLKMKSK